MNAAEGLLGLTDARFISAPERSDRFAAVDFNNDVNYGKSFSYGIWQGFKAEYYYSQKSCAAYLDIDKTTVLVIFYPGCDMTGLPDKWLGADILVCRAVPPAGIDASRFGMTVISSSGEKSAKAVKRIIANGGRAYTTSEGSITVRTRGDSVCSIRIAYACHRIAGVGATMTSHNLNCRGRRPDDPFAVSPLSNVFNSERIVLY